ncbi:MAG: hypothetical protein KDD47_20300, partial [Acidobacteria bacterium]|nr:hypothetical protein [Acidobacteriota bacterium]
PSPKSAEEVLRLAEDFGVPALDAGEVVGNVLDVRSGEGRLRLAVPDAREAWRTGLPRALGL